MRHTTNTNFLADTTMLQYQHFRSNGSRRYLGAGQDTSEWTKQEKSPIDRRARARDIRGESLTQRVASISLEL